MKIDYVVIVGNGLSCNPYTITQFLWTSIIDRSGELNVIALIVRSESQAVFSIALANRLY